MGTHFKSLFFPLEARTVIVRRVMSTEGHRRVLISQERNPV